MPCFIFGFAKANLVEEGCHMLDAVACAPPFNQKECTLCNGNAFTLGVPNMPSICQALFFRYCRGPTQMTLRSLSHLTAERHGFPGMNLELSAAVSSILLPRMCVCVCLCHVTWHKHRQPMACGTCMCCCHPIPCAWGHRAFTRFCCLSDLVMIVVG